MNWFGYQAARALGNLVRGEWGSTAARGGDYILPDERARQSAGAQLAADPEVDARGVELSVLSGELTITGTVPTTFMKTRAEEICRSVAGVLTVRNELSVQQSTGA
jgi:osmotically-inducible protein OsmY